MRAIVLVVGLADLALEARLDLSADTDAVANLAGGHFVTSFDHFTDNLMTNADWQRAVPPAPVDGMKVGAADTAGFDLNIDIAVFEWLWLKL